MCYLMKEDWGAWWWVMVDNDGESKAASAPVATKRLLVPDTRVTAGLVMTLWKADESVVVGC